MVTGNGTGRYSGDITKKLWRGLNNLVSLAHFLLSCREGHSRDDNNKVMLSLRSISFPRATKYKASCSVLDHLNFVNIAELDGMGPKLWQHILKSVIQIAYN